MRKLLYEYLAIEKGLAGGRVYWGLMENDPVTQKPPALPYINLSIILTELDFTCDGPSGLYISHCKASCFGVTVEQVDELAVQVVNALTAWAGADGVQAAFPNMGPDLPEEDTGLHHIPVTFKVWHTSI